MAKVMVKALQAHTAFGGSYGPGDTYEVDEEIVGSLVVQGKAAPVESTGSTGPAQVTGVEVAQGNPVPVMTTDTWLPARGTYRTTHLRPVNNRALTSAPKKAKTAKKAKAKTAKKAKRRRDL